MKKSLSIIIKSIAMAALLMVSAGAHAAEVVYRIVEYNKTTQDFILSASGQVPKGSYAWFENEYGATTGNRYNQIPRNRKATLWLSGWQGCTIRRITFSMCSNSKTGQVGFSVGEGKSATLVFPPRDFADEAWFGQWVSKDLGVYVDITQPVMAESFASDLANITLQGGTAEGSVYIDAITIRYDESPGTVLESPLGWSYDKLTKKSTLHEGDELMIFRNGCAAADIDGMESTSHYLDAIAVTSTGDVSDPRCCASPWASRPTTPLTGPSPTSMAADSELRARGLWHGTRASPPGQSTWASMAPPSQAPTALTARCASMLLQGVIPASISIPPPRCPCLSSIARRSRTRQWCPPLSPLLSQR